MDNQIVILKKFKENNRIKVNYICPFCKQIKKTRAERIKHIKSCHKCHHQQDRPDKPEGNFVWCNCCRKYKDIKHFNMRKGNKIRQCRECEKDYRSKIPKDKTNQYAREWYLSNINKVLYYHSKSRAKKLNLPFDLSIEDIKIPLTCPILNTKITVREEKINSPSIDRINPKGGYTKDNIQVISWRANWLKNNASFSEIERLYNFMKKKELNGIAGGKRV
jgi:hypothetical protein